MSAFTDDPILDPLSIGMDKRMGRLNTPGRTSTTPTGYGTREQYTPGTSFTSNDPLQGSLVDELGLPLDPLGLYDVPQIQVDLERIDPRYLSDMAYDQARLNIGRSIGLEEMYDPLTAASREEAMRRFMQDVESGGSLGMDVEAKLKQLMGTDLAVPELERSALLDRAREEAMRELELGYDLPQDVRNLVMRTAAGKGSSSGFLGGQGGRDIGARDLGLTSMDIFNQRLGRASQMGMQEEATNVGQQGLKAQIAQINKQFGLQAGQALQNKRQTEFANRFGMTQFTQGLERPVSGIDPGDLASFMVADVNQRNQLVNQANVAQLEAATNAKEGQNQLIGDVFGGIMGAFCWVAREVYPDSRWKLFRLWLVNHADNAFFNWYRTQGPTFAEYLHVNPVLKPLIKYWMDKRIDVVLRNGVNTYQPYEYTLAQLLA